MNAPIPDPVRGKDVIEWAVPVTRALNALHDHTGATVRNERDRRDRPPHPFEVRWFGEANDGDGAWCIYLPIPSHMVMVDGEYVPGIDGYIDAPDELPELWYYIADAEDDAVVWLNVTVVESSHTVTAALSTSPGQSSTGVKVYPVALGTNIVEENADGVKTHRYFALVDSAVVLSTASGGGEPTEPAIPRPFDIVNGKVVRCMIPAPVAVLSCGDYTINTRGGNIYAHVDRNTNGYTLSVDQTSRVNTSTHAQWQLYAYVAGQATMDTRPTVLPVYDIT